ncbi:MAG TPA: hypothetical protein VNZ46_02260 [Pedobacter sp.]|jgi:hypothetical protein|nr:hypothetical protein [Pedobacter sp.]
MKTKLISFWQKYGPHIEFLWIIVLLIGNTYMKHSIAFKGIAVAGWMICLVLYIISEQNFRTIRFWFFLIFGLLLAINQTVQFISMMN